MSATSSVLAEVSSVSQPARQLVAVDAGQPDVDEGDVGRVRLCGVEGCARVADRAYPMSERPQEQGERLRGVRVVLDQEDAQGLLGRRSPRARASCCRSRRLAERQPHLELGASPRTCAPRLHAPAVELHQPPRHREADAEAAGRAVEPLRALREEIEHVRQQLGRDPGAVVPNANHRLSALAAGRDLDPAARLRVLGGVRRRLPKTCASRSSSPSTSSRGSSRTSSRWPRVSVTMRIASSARSTARPSSTGARRSSILPLWMRATSSRSSTRRASWSA